MCTGRETIFLALPQPMEKGEPKFHTLNPREIHIRSLGHTFKVVQQYENPHICRMLKETLPGNQAHLTNHSQGQALNFHLEIFSSNSPGGGGAQLSRKKQLLNFCPLSNTRTFSTAFFYFTATPPPSKKGQNPMCERNQELKARYRSPSFSGGTNNMKITYQIKKKICSGSRV